MNKHNLKGFSLEIKKEATPRFIMKMLSPLKSWRAGVKGEKAMIKTVDREAKQIRRLNPEHDISTFKAKRMAQLEEAGSKAGTDLEKNILEGSKKTPTGQGFLSRHKGKLLIGGAAAGGLYLASKPVDKEEEARKKARMALRNMNIPQRVYYN